MSVHVGLRVEQDVGPDPSLARLGTARTAFVGRTLRGPVNRPVFLKSFVDFQQIFGGLWQPSPLGYAVQHYFDNGGREAIIVRVVNAARASTMTLPAGAGSLCLKAVRPGTREFLRACVDYDNIAPENVAEFNLTVQRVHLQGTQQVDDQEIFCRLSLLPEADRYVRGVLAESELIEIVGEVPAVRPDKTLDASSGHATRYVNSNADGDDGAPLTDYDLIGSQIDHSGLFALDAGEHFNLLCIPPLSRTQDVGLSTLLVAARYCKQRRALLIVDPPADWHTADDALRGMRDWALPNENALMYFPWVLAHDKLRGHFESFAPCGAVAGMLARSDETSPVWGPAKSDDAILRPGFRPSCMVAEDRRKRLAAMGVKTLQAVRAVARIGASPRTLAGGMASAADWQCLATRRLALFILNSLERSTRWAVLAEMDATVAPRVASQVRTFFERLYAAGAFGERPLEEAFFVISDSRLNTAADLLAGVFQLLVGFAASRKHDFHCYRIVHTRRECKILPASLNRMTAVQYSPEELEWVETLASQLQ